MPEVDHLQIAKDSLKQPTGPNSSPVQVAIAHAVIALVESLREFWEEQRPPNDENKDG